MALEMVLGSKFPWKQGQALLSGVSWLELAGAEDGLSQYSWGVGAGEGPRCKVKGTSASFLSELFMREDEGPLQPLGNEKNQWTGSLQGAGLGPPLHSQLQSTQAHPLYHLRQ